MREYTPYNPLDKKNLGRSVADALLANSAVNLTDLEIFKGAGIYAIYYGGNFEPYEGLVSKVKIGEPLSPIYVGKAVPPGSRKGNAEIDADPGTVLYRRLKKHTESIQLAENLDVNDFTTRYLVVEDIWIPLGESLLIARFSPLWNKIVDGFGNHDPGSGRYQQLRSRWDVLHPGRPWALKCAERGETLKDISRDVTTFIAAFG